MNVSVNGERLVWALHKYPSNSIYRVIVYTLSTVVF